MPNDMRNRFIELIQDIKLCNPTNWDKPEFMALALLANGAILPPCKVGDKVYFDTYLHGDSVGVQSHKVINVKYIIITEPSKGGIGAEIPDYAFGKTVFLALEDAVKALRERDNNG